MTTNRNAPLAGKGEFGNTSLSNYITKKFPPYGKQFDEFRRKGLIPAQRVIVSTDWKLGEAYPRILIPTDAKVDKLIFSYLAGLSVQIVHHTGEAELVGNLIDAILKVKPKVLTLFNFDVAQQKDPRYSAFTLIHPAWEIIQYDL
ncbi:hypothetical protein [Nitrosomonas sp.]|uniref:hypothetical protein n=1 Tax=Nitrosomonas sp. TaxID=42353 RepID=UPI002606EC8B|nr:hypothetical protein [Nitrosomonas sp.]